MIKGKKVLGVITARGGSVRLPRKNLLKIGKYTLLEHLSDKPGNPNLLIL